MTEGQPTKKAWWEQAPDEEKQTMALVETVLENEANKDASRLQDVSHKTAQSINFLEDPTWEMTYGRRLARWLEQKGWYGNGTDRTGDPDAPSLEKAWAFFEHVTLQRHVVEEQDRSAGPAKGKDVFRQGERQLHLAEPGESEYPTHLYPIFSTPLSQLGDFGLGFGIYFATIRDFAILAFICGLISIPNIIYFASEEYSGDQEGVPALLRGSAICTNRTWVPCVNCTQDQFDGSTKGSYEVKRFAPAWTVIPVESGYYLNVSDYLDWQLNGTTGQLARTEQRVVRIDRLLNASIPPEYGIELSAEGGYVLNGHNVTERLGYTPLWCGYSGPLHCYLDLYPFFEEKHDEDVTHDAALMAPVEYTGDTDFIQIGFALRNNCIGATRSQGLFNWATLLVIVFGAFYIRVRNSKIETKFDEDEQTAQDYSIVVKNPPDDAWDPEEWKQFFERALQQEKSDSNNSDKTNHVTVCTVDVDNELVIQYLVERREALRKIEVTLPPGTPLDMNSLEEQAKQAEAESSGGGCMGSSPIPKMVQHLKDTEDKIKEFFASTTKPPTTKVYITFETEAAQRTILTHMSVASKKAHKNDTSVVAPKYLFRGKHVLHLREAHEPSTIRWQDLNATKQAMTYRKIATTLATLAAMVIAYFIIRGLYQKNWNALAGIITTVFTALFPMVAVALMEVEKHHSETSRQAWLFAKVALFNIFVTTVLLTLVTPFEATLDRKEKSAPGLLPAVYALFFSQIGLTPALQLLDIGGNVKRHLLAPKGKTQDEMNLLMMGTPVHLAERYGNLMKYLYMTLWYCSIYPGVFFMGAFAFMITYFVDRFSLMRSWARSPHVGAEIAYFARQYLTPTAICLMSVMSAYYWSGFPYDNLCPDENTTLPPYYVGYFDIDLAATSEKFGFISLSSADEVRANFTIDAGAKIYRYCNQDLKSTPGLSFPALPQWQPEGDEWMTPEQEEVVSFHGWTSLAVLVIIAGSIGLTIFATFDTGSYTPRGEDQKINFSDVQNIASYIPQVTSTLIPYPLLLCDIKNIDIQLFEWRDPDKPHSHYDVTNDLAAVLGSSDHPNVFAKVQHWPPYEVNQEAEEQAIGGKPEQDSQDSVVPYPPNVTSLAHGGY